jgi:uncharacterized protein (DUF2141 family)
MKTSKFLSILFLALLPLVACKKKVTTTQPDPEPIEELDSSETSTNNFSKLIIKISGMKNENGKMNIALYNKSEGFNDPSKVFKEFFLLIDEDPMIVSIDSLPAGEYAFGIFHDENDNQVLDQNFLGIPKEGFAFSNNAMGSFGPPTYSQAKFMIPVKSQVTQLIDLKFF